ncbi:MAG: 4Fe-4S dicluster domain-containing protein [Oscillospiraceae bacterium]|nr:4Fe-4S dicluster domain-containing protein [Oscillospiraceae bacterium]
MACTIKPEEIKRVKAMGFLHNKGTDLFSGRILTGYGKLTAAQLSVIAEAAEKFGSGEAVFTTRLTVEIPGIPLDQIEAFQAFLAGAGLETGGTGARVRPVVSCKGTTCRYGLIDTFALAQEIHERFFKGYHQVRLPHKFKIAVGGCPNNCVKPALNDVGIMGQRVPVLEEELCRGCRKCAVEAVCPMEASRPEEGRLRRDAERCNNCGRCVGACYFDAVKARTEGYRIFIGGRWGRKIVLGQPLTPIFTSREEVLSVIEKALLLFKDKGRTGERFSGLIERLGFEQAEALLLGDELLQRKAEILTKE